jgi:hypothetical protein
MNTTYDVITYQHAYIGGTTSLCAQCLADEATLLRQRRWRLGGLLDPRRRYSANDDGVSAVCSIRVAS